jgi:monoamine oxidase
MPHDEVDVAVIGAGAAGLGAALTLAQSGLSYIVLEARERPGGRAWTTTLANGEAVDLGCGWLHSADANPLVAIAEAQGRRIDRSAPPWARDDAHIGPNRDRMAAFGAAIGRFRARVEARPADAPDVALDALLDPADPFNPMIDAVSTYYSGAELHKISAADLAAYDDTGVNWRVRGGYGAVFAEIAKGLNVRYGCEVRAVDRSRRTLAVETPQGIVRARAVIVTLPSDVIAETPDLFRPALPDKAQAAADLPLGLADKIYIEVLAPQDFPADSRAFGDIGRRGTGAYHFRPQGRPLIEGFFGGECAEALERGGEGAAWDFALSELVGLFGAGIAKNLRPLRFYGWRTDPFARGAYSYARPGKASNRLALAAPVEDRIFFAGEACSPNLFSTAHGAFETGRSAAARLRRPGAA